MDAAAAAAAKTSRGVVFDTLIPFKGMTCLNIVTGVILTFPNVARMSSQVRMTRPAGARVEIASPWYVM